MPLRARATRTLTPTRPTLTRAGLTSAASAVVQSALPTKFIPGLNKVSAVGLKGALQGAGNYAEKVALGGAGGFAGDYVDQFGNSVGTDKGFNYDPNRGVNAAIGGAATAGTIGAPRGVADVVRAARRAEFGGANQAATEAVASRLSDNAGQDGLGGMFNGKRDYRAMDATQKGLRNELGSVDTGSFTPDQLNAHALAKGGSRLTSDHVDAITAADPAAGHLANQLRMSQLMTDFGTYDRTNSVWSGGMSGKMDKLMRNYVDPTKVAVGAAAGKLMGLHLLGTASPAFAGAAAGTYGLARLADSMTGARSPAASFADQFQNAQAATRLPPAQPQAQPQQQAQPMPWGPKPQPTTSVPQVAPGAAQAAEAQAQADANWKVMRKQADSENDHHDLMWKIMRDQADSENKGENADYKVQQAQALSENKARSAMTSASLKQQIANAKVERAQADSENKARDANWRANVTQAHSENQTSNKDFRANQVQAESENRARNQAAEAEDAPAPAPVDPTAQAAAQFKAMLAKRAYLAKVQQNSTPPAPQMPAAPAAPAPMDPLRLPTDITGPARNLMRGEALKAKLLAANTPQPEAAPAMKITKASGGTVKTEAAPRTLHAAAAPLGPQPTDYYRQLDPSEMRFQGKDPGFIADTLSKERMVGKPQEVVDNYKKSVLDTHTERRGIVQAVMARNPLDTPKLQELIDQLHERGSLAQGMAAVRHYAKQVSPQAAGDLLSGFNDTAAQRIWATPAQKKAARAALKKKHSKNETQSAGTS
jgi:hypothetical protein